MFSKLKSAAAKLSGGGGKKRDYQVPANLTPAEQKEIQQIIERASPDREVPHTAQESIPFERMFPDGICRVTENYYTKTIQFQDINYQLAQQEDKSAIFDEWCSFLNFFDSSIKFELSFVNTATDVSDFARQVQIPPQNDGFNAVRAEYSSMLKRQLAQGNNGLTKRKYLTFGIEADSLKQARPRLAHIETDLISNFRRIGVITHVLDGKERLKLMHGMFHMGDPDKFYFDWKWLTESGLSVKDFIAPTAFAFPKSRLFQMGGIYSAVSYLQITASDLSDQLLKKFLDSGGSDTEEDAETVTEAEAEEDTDSDEESGDALTPDGNLTLVDDFGSSTKAGKQFITLVTKDGKQYVQILIPNQDPFDSRPWQTQRSKVSNRDLKKMVEAYKKHPREPALDQLSKPSKSAAAKAEKNAPARKTTDVER